MRAIVLLTLVLAGCAAGGDNGIADASSTTVSQQMTRGRTTQAEVRQLYGAPSGVQLSGTGETWTYAYMRAQSQPANFIPIVNLFTSGVQTERTVMVVMFDKNKVVQDYTINR